jgi:hypothetical protein
VCEEDGEELAGSDAAVSAENVVLHSLDHVDATQRGDFQRFG